MAKKNVPQQQEVGFNDYLKYNNNTKGLNYIGELEKGGHKLSVKGAGHIEYIIFETVNGYDVFENEKNRAIYADILQMSSEVGNSAVVLAYNVVPGSAHILLKGDSNVALKTYERVVNDIFVKRYDDGKQSVGYPFKVFVKRQTIPTGLGTGPLWNVIAKIYSYSPMDFRKYPYNNFRKVTKGNSISNLGLGVELKLIHPKEFEAELMNRVVPGMEYYNGGRESLNLVLEDMRKRYVYSYARMKEDTLALMLGEACVRTGTPYAKLAKKMKVGKDRHDLVVTTLCSHMIRRKATFEQATSELSLGTEKRENLLIETLAELNRLTGYSYEYIMINMMQEQDPGYELLITTFRHLHEARGWNFAELCQKYHLTRDIMYIGSQCGF